MAYIRKIDGRWRAEVQRSGKRTSKRFATKREAELWAASQETKIVSSADAPDYDYTVQQGIDRYQKEVTAHKASAKQERLRLDRFLRDFPQIAQMRLCDVRAADLALWRDARLQKVQASSVLREIVPIRHMFKLAGLEWGWMPKDNPFDGMRKPKEAPPRNRRITPQEARRIMRAMGYVSRQAPTNKTCEVAWAFIVSLHTALRTSEILNLSRQTVDLRRRVVTLKTHKTAHQVGGREVPITKRAAFLLGILFDAAAGRDNLFTINAASKDALFRRYVTGLGIEDLTFHDARAEALTRLSRRVDVMTLAKISGHRDLNILQNTYYRESASDIAARLP